MGSWKDDGNRQTSVKGYRVGFWALVLVFPFIFNLSVNLPVRNVTISSSPFLPCNVCLLPGRSQVKCGSLLVPPHLFNQDGHPSPVPHSSVPSCFKEYNVCLLTCFCLMVCTWRCDPTPYLFSPQTVCGTLVDLSVVTSLLIVSFTVCLFFSLAPLLYEWANADRTWHGCGCAKNPSGLQALCWSPR